MNVLDNVQLFENNSDAIIDADGAEDGTNNKTVRNKMKSKKVCKIERKTEGITEITMKSKTELPKPIAIDNRVSL